MKFPFPAWIELMPEGPNKWRAKNRFVLRLCLLYAHERGRIEDLARLLGVNESTLKSQIHSRKCLSSELVRTRIKQSLGEAFVPPVPPRGEDGIRYDFW
jgi:hypothetical protein